MSFDEYLLYTQSCGLFSKYRCRGVWEDWQSEQSFIRSESDKSQSSGQQLSQGLTSPFGFLSSTLRLC